MKRDRWIGYLLILPAVFVIFCVFFYPLFTAVDMSLHKFILTKPGSQPFVGLKNYWDLIKNPIFSNSLEKTAIWTGVNLFAQLFFGILVALLLNQNFRGRALARAAVLVPWVTPSVVAVLSWRWMYDAQFGIINDLLVKLGLIEKGIAWLGNTNTAMAAVIVESIWKGTPFVAIMILASLQTVPKDMYDAAKVDGAGSIACFFNVTVPLIMPTLMIAATLTTIYTFNSFNAIWLMTEGGPLRATETLTMLVYTLAFRDFNFGQASAAGVITLLVLLVFVILFGRRYIRSEMNL